MSDTQKNNKARPEPTYGEIVWGQFRKNWIGFGALLFFLLLFVIAMAAPLLASDQPFSITVLGNSPANVDIAAGTYHPWIDGLLFNKYVYGRGVDIFFNLLLVLVPIITVAFLIFRKTALKGVAGRVRGRRRKRFVYASVLIIFACFVVLLWKQPQVDIPKWKNLLESQQAQCLAHQGGDFASGDATPEQIEEVCPISPSCDADDVWLCEASFPLINYSFAETSYNANRPPSPENLLGTDSSGRDQFTRMIYGTRISLTIGVIAVGIYLFIGIVLGSLAGFFGRKWD
ncbi:MAG: hypothetical protein KC561_16870, partial [Myxococcales bacterium]|nr:hypothetical protein [Myxococcales bacterium]